MNDPRSSDCRRRFGCAVFGVFLLSSLWFAGCAVGPDYHRPELSPPPDFRGQAAQTNSTNSFADLPWWEVFRDETLQGLIRTALSNNYDLRIAVSRVEQARQFAIQSRSEFFPQLGYTGAVARGKNSSGNSAVFENGETSDVFLAAGNVSWEIDLWGRIRRLNESARAQYLATEEARRDVTITVISQIAQAYFQLIQLDELLEIARRATNSFGDSLKIFSDRLRGGVASRLETSSAEALMASSAAAIPETERQIVVQENLLNYLLGQNPRPVARRAVPTNDISAPEVPAGLPSSLLERRPDIRESEQLLRSANAQIGVAQAEFFPQLNLTGLFGQVSPELSAFTLGGANAWALAANLSGPLFQGGRLTAQYRQAKAAADQARLQYQATALNALQEVSDALVSRQKFVEERAQQTVAVAAYQTAVQIATDRYRQGQASYYEVLQQQQLLFPAEQQLSQAKLNQFLALVQLYRSLGGGWTNEVQ